MTTLFKDARLKVERAEKHIGDLNSRMRSFVASDYCTLRVEHDANTRQNSLKFRATKPIPNDISLVAGDAIHNLRTALDFLVSDVLFHESGKRARHAKFPVYETREELVAALHNRKVEQPSANISDHLLSVIKPYKGGNDLICALHRLDIEDKHRHRIAMIEVTALNGVDAEGKGSRPFRILGYMSLSDGAMEMRPFITDGEIHIYNYGQPTFQILFSKGLPMEGKPIVPTLLGFRDEVIKVIAGFEAMFP